MAKTAPLMPAALQRAESMRNLYALQLPEGVTRADLETKELWANTIYTIEKGDRIEAISADGETFYDILVADVAKDTTGTRTLRTPRVVVLNEYPIGKASKKPAAAPAAKPAADDDDDKDEVPDGYSVAYGGPRYKWRVIQDGIADPLADGMSKKADAIAWAKQHAER